MKKLLFIVYPIFFVIQSCAVDDKKPSDDKIKNTVEEIALNFETQEIYKELIRRSSGFSNAIPSFTKDTGLSYPNFDTLKNKMDTIIKPSESDTLLLTSIKQKLSKYSDRELFHAYNMILKQRDENKGIYDIDNRMDMESDLPENYVSASKTVFAIIHKKYFVNNGEVFTLKSKGSYLKVYKLCNNNNEEAFAKQSLFADCTAFAISKNNIVTAGHCIDKTNYKNYLLVSDFTTQNVDSFLRYGIPQSLVYKITQVKDRGINEKDFSVFEVDKSISQNRIAKVSNKTTYTSDDYFFVIGFPCGLPMKICNNAPFRENVHPFYFQISSDTYGGNSGSPVFNENTNEVEGILVRGNQDFYFNNNGCRSSIRCPEFGCRGEDVTKIQLIKKYAQ